MPLPDSSALNMAPAAMASWMGDVDSTASTHDAAIAAFNAYQPGGTDVAVADGGTGASTAANARTNLGLVIGTDVAAQSSLDQLDWKASCRVCSTTNVALATGLENGDTIDGVTLSTGNRVLLTGQTAGAENGIYVVVASGAASRATDASTSAEVTSGMAVVVTEGTANGDAIWLLTTNDPITLDTTALVFTKFGAFTAADRTKLDGIEALADVTDATNVAAAGAVMESDTTTAAMSFVIDEDNMASDSATKVPTQQSVKAYADLKVAKATFPEVLIVAVGDETTAITTGTAKVTFRMPFAMTLTAVRASLTTASSSGTPTFDINETGTTVLSTKLTIDANEKTSTTAATAAVISDSALADDAEITIDVDTAGTGAAGAKIYLIGTRAL